MNRLQTAIEKIHPPEEMRETVYRRVALKKRREFKFYLRYALPTAICVLCALLVLSQVPALRKDKGVDFGTPQTEIHFPTPLILAEYVGGTPSVIVYHGQYYTEEKTYRTSLSPKEPNSLIPYNDNARLLIGEPLGKTALNELEGNGGYFSDKVDVTEYTDLTSDLPDLEVYAVKGYAPEKVLMTVKDGGTATFWLPVRNQ